MHQWKPGQDLQLFTICFVAVKIVVRWHVGHCFIISFSIVYTGRFFHPNRIGGVPEMPRVGYYYLWLIVGNRMRCAIFNFQEYFLCTKFKSKIEITRKAFFFLLKKIIIRIRSVSNTFSATSITILMFSMCSIMINLMSRRIQETKLYANNDFLQVGCVNVVWNT